MKRTVLLLCAACIAGGAVAPAARAAQSTIRAVSFQPESVSFARPFFRWVRETNERCREHLEVRASGPDAIPAPLQWDALRTGKVDVYFGPASYYRGALPHADVLALARNDPGAQRRNGAWERLNRLHNEHVNAWYLTTLAAGIRFFVYTTRPAPGANLEGLRLRAVPLYEGFLRSLGAQPRFMGADAVADALGRGVVDGYVWPLWSAGLGWERFVRYRYGPGFLDTASPVLVNLDRWRALGEAERACLTEMALWVEAQWPAWRAEESERQLAALREAGVEYVELDADLAAKAEGILWKMLEVAEPEFVRDVRPLLAGSP